MLRPLVAWDKSEIVREAQDIGTYEIANLPAEDCCTLFASPLAETRAAPAGAVKIEQRLDLDGTVAALLETAEVVRPRRESPSVQPALPITQATSRVDAARQSSRWRGTLAPHLASRSHGRSQPRLAALVVGVTGFAASSAPPHEARALGELFFNKNMARAEVVIVRGGIVHDYRIDQGKVVGVRGGSIELLEQDGTRQLIPVSPTAQVIVNGRFDALAAIPLRMNAITIRDGDSPATSVRVTGLPSGDGAGSGVSAAGGTDGRHRAPRRGRGGDRRDRADVPRPRRLPRGLGAHRRGGARGVHPPPIRIVVLDIGLPGVDGFEVCRRIRAQSAVPILMLTARTRAGPRRRSRARRRRLRAEAVLAARARRPCEGDPPPLRALAAREPHRAR